jgi:protein-tyrosine phosphatase
MPFVRTPRSNDVRVKIYWISGIDPGQLGIMPRPRGGDWLGDEIVSLKMSGVDAVVSLLERAEVAELDISEEQALCEAEGISFLSFPIPDRDVLPSEREALDFARSLSHYLREGKSVVIHCRQDVGRSALIAACVMALLGVSVDEAFEKIEAARGCHVPDTPEQRAWVARLAGSL